MCIETDLQQLVANKTFDNIAHLRGSIEQVVGSAVVFDKFGPPQNGVVHILRNSLGSDWSCDLRPKVLSF